MTIFFFEKMYQIIGTKKQRDTPHHDKPITHPIGWEGAGPAGSRRVMDGLAAVDDAARPDQSARTARKSSELRKRERERARERESRVYLRSKAQ